MVYDNTNYWKDIHGKHFGNLKAVGHPHLSEALNELKYKSEAGTMVDALETVAQNFKAQGLTTIKVLDVGAGTGYWSNVIYDVFIAMGFQVEITALDISEKALAHIEQTAPHIKILKHDLKTIDPKIYQEKFNLVNTCYCLHHIVDPSAFLNAMHFVGNSVIKGGYAFIMDPILQMSYSPFDNIDFSQYTGNGLPRRLSYIKTKMISIGLTNLHNKPAVSFVLNGSIEGRCKWDYKLTNKIWLIFCNLLYRSDKIVSKFRYFLSRTDQILKISSFSLSSTLCVFEKNYGIQKSSIYQDL